MNLYYNVCILLRWWHDEAIIYYEQIKILNTYIVACESLTIYLLYQL